MKIPRVILLGLLFQILLPQAASAEEGEFSWSGISWKALDISTNEQNVFSKNRVYVDSENRLHLEIRYVDGVWQYPHVVSVETNGYGVYRFYVDSDLTTLPENVIAGFFLYDKDPTFGHREKSIQYSSGDVLNPYAPLQYANEPSEYPNRRHQLMPDTSTTNSTHTIAFLPNVVTYSSYSGHPNFGDEINSKYALDVSYNLSPASPVWMQHDVYSSIQQEQGVIAVTNILASTNDQAYFRTRLVAVGENSTTEPFGQWTQDFQPNLNRLEDFIPPCGNEQINMSLWLGQGEAPSNDTNQVFTLILKSVERIPLDQEKFQPFLSDLKFNTNNPVGAKMIEVKINFSAN